ncbi:MAG: cyclase family protein [Vicinamibacterales bacterium]
MSARRFRLIPALTIAGAAVTLFAAGCTAPDRSPEALLAGGDIVDLSHAYGPDTIFWPTAEPFHLETVADGETPGGWYYAANNFLGAEHGGTHIDAPVHFARGRETVDQIPLEHLIGPALLLDVSAGADADPDYQVTVADLEAWEATHGEMEDDAILLIRTGFSSRWPDAARYLGTAERGEAAVPKLHFPGLHPDAARWLVANRRLHAIGIDTASIDYGQSSEFGSHRVLYDQNIPAFENLTNLDRLPARGAIIIALPMKIAGGSGAPLRAVALLR